MNPYSIVFASAALAAGLVMSGQASAVTVSRDYASHGTANCQASLPVFDGNLRKRPMGVANEGTTTAFITCDSENIDNLQAGNTQVGVFFRNRAGTAGITVSCTLVNGFFTASKFLPKTSSALAVGGITGITWTAAGDNGGTNFTGAAVSCGLPPGVDLSAVEYVYPEDVGA
jgi:hypothetical protein